MEELNNQQKKAVESDLLPTLVLSGAGTGKTRVVINRFLHYLNFNIKAYEILCITFTNKAAAEMVNRLKNKFIEAEWVGTFHKIAYKLMIYYGLVNSNTNIIDEHDQNYILTKLNIKESANDINYARETRNIPPFLQSSCRKYIKYLEENNLMDFSEIINKLIENLEKNKELREQVQLRFKAIIIDEYQDINPVQINFIKMLLGENKNIFAVGDPNQSIFAFRGSDISYILNFSNDFFINKNNERFYQLFKLEENYRSTNEILKVANSISKLQLIGSIFLQTKKKGDLVTVVNCNNNEAKFIANEILNYKTDTAILVRSSRQIKPIEDALISNQIKYSVVGGIRFFERFEIKLIMSFLKLIYKNDLISFSYISRKIIKGVGDKNVERIIELVEKNNISLMEALYTSKKTIDFAEKLQSFNKNVNPFILIENIIFHFNLKEFIKSDDGLNREENIDMLKDKIIKYKSIEEFLQDFSIIDDSKEELVKIMTIHSAKGLEFDTVFIPGLVEGNFPNIKSIQSNNIQEETRLFYVAVTRAKNKLYLLYDNNSFRFKTISKFLLRLPPDVITRVYY